MQNERSVENELQYELAAEYYDLVFGSRQDIKFYLDMAECVGGPVLEAACGTGRIMVPIAASGIEITGFDISRARLALCRSKLEMLDPKIKRKTALFELNMIDFHLERKFSLAIIPFRGFQHILDCSSQLKSLRCFAEHLLPGGVLVFDVYNPSIPILADPAVLTEVPTDQKCVTRRGEEVHVWERVVARNYNEQRIEAQEIYKILHPGGRREQHVLNYSVRYTFRCELEHMLENAGFTVKEIFCDFNRTPFGEVYPGDIVVVARKN